jgi:hypothetical protein
MPKKEIYYKIVKIKDLMAANMKTKQYSWILHHAVLQKVADILEVLNASIRTMSWSISVRVHDCHKRLSPFYIKKHICCRYMEFIHETRIISLR